MADGLGVAAAQPVAERADDRCRALLVGGTFMVITLAGVQEIRARAPREPRAGRPHDGRLRAGQIAGPVAVRLLLHCPACARTA
jgi:hypothetical protein